MDSSTTVFVIEDNFLGLNLEPHGPDLGLECRVLEIGMKPANSSTYRCQLSRNLRFFNFFIKSTSLNSSILIDKNGRQYNGDCLKSVVCVYYLERHGTASTDVGLRMTFISSGKAWKGLKSTQHHRRRQDFKSGGPCARVTMFGGSAYEVLFVYRNRLHYTTENNCQKVEVPGTITLKKLGCPGTQVPMVTTPMPNTRRSQSIISFVKQL
jgi:hypothetical protein